MWHEKDRCLNIISSSLYFYQLIAMGWVHHTRACTSRRAACLASPCQRSTRTEACTRPLHERESFIFYFFSFWIFDSFILIYYLPLLVFNSDRSDLKTCTFILIVTDLAVWLGCSSTYKIGPPQLQSKNTTKSFSLLLLRAPLLQIFAGLKSSSMLF